MADHTDHVLERTLGSADVPDSLQFRPDRLQDIRRRARRRGRTRLVSGLVGAAAVGVAATAVGSSLFTPGEVVTGAPSQDSSSAETDAQPSPWSDTPVAEDMDGPAFSVPGTAYLIADGSVEGQQWVAASGNAADPSPSCVFVKGDGLFTTMQAACFDVWDGTELANWATFHPETAEEGTVIVGAVDTSARQVIITFDDGGREVVDAVATPTSGELRFFATSTSQPMAVRTVVPLDAAGAPAAPPNKAQAPLCDSACPTPAS